MNRRLLLASLGFAAVTASAQQPASVRLRGTIEALSDSRLVLRERSGQRISLRPGERGLLGVGNSVSLTAQELNGHPTAVRISAGRNGFAPPY